MQIFAITHFQTDACKELTNKLKECTIDIICVEKYAYFFKHAIHIDANDLERRLKAESERVSTSYLHDVLCRFHNAGFIVFAILLVFLLISLMPRPCLSRDISRRLRRPRMF